MNVDYDSPSYHQLRLLGNITSGLSFFGGLWMFFMFMRTWRLWTYSGKMVLCLTISYFLYTLANILGNYERGQGFICQVDGFTRTFGIVASFYWAFRIVRSAYTSMIDPDYSSIRRNSLPQLMKGFILPLIFASL